MGRIYMGTDVFNEAIDRMVAVYEEGHRVVVSYSAGKDSTAVLEICTIAASLTNRLPVEVVMRDEEIVYPGTMELALEVAVRPEVEFHWFIQPQPCINLANRVNPYWWMFDETIDPDTWVRQPPPFAERIKEAAIEEMVIHSRFPPPPGKKLYAVIGLRVQESRGRLMGLHSSGGYLTRAPNRHGVYYARPIYDWTDGDVWKAILDNRWNYNKAYTTLLQMGCPRHNLRIGPPTMTIGGVQSMHLAAKAWPKWFDRVCERLPGVRTIAQFGVKAVTPPRKLGETWEECYQRTCIDNAPDWIAARSIKLRDTFLANHRSHATTPLPEVKCCRRCTAYKGAWRKLTEIAYNGDAFGIGSNGLLPAMEPEFFRAGAGTWDNPGVMAEGLDVAVHVGDAVVNDGIEEDSDE